MIIKYKTNYIDDSIEKVEVVRETDKCVFLLRYKRNPNSERRESKISGYESYFDSFQDAKDNLLLLSSKRLASVESKFKSEFKKRQKIESLGVESL